MIASKKYHFISVNESLTSRLAESLSRLGYVISGSDVSEGDPLKISGDLSGVIVGVKVTKDNPEVLRAQQLGLKVYTIPEFIFDFAQDKQRLVIVGSKGRNIIASIIVHVLQDQKRHFDYILHTAPDQQAIVQLSDAPLIVVEASDNPSSALYHTPSFIKYKHHIGVISTIDWQSSAKNMSEDDYMRQFDLFADATPKGGILVYGEMDKVATVLCNKERPDVSYVSFKTHASTTENNKEFLIGNHKERIPLNLTGKQNFQYISGALETLKKIGITQDQFYSSIATLTAGNPII